MIILAGSSHGDLVHLIRKQLMLQEHEVVFTRFANGEINVDINVSVRDQNVFIVQTGFGSINDMIMELLITIHACKISSAKRITAVIPYVPYSKQASLPDLNGPDIQPTLGPRRRSIASLSSQFDSLVVKSDKPSEEYVTWPVQTNTVIANMLTTAGADHIITMELHDPQFQGFFDIPLENLPSTPLIMKRLNLLPFKREELILVSPDAGGAKRTAQLAESLGIDFALVHQDRRTGAITDRNILIGDVKDRVAILVDDIADTCETLVNASELIQQKGASKIYAFITHGIFSDHALDNLERTHIDTIFISNTIPQDRALARGSRFQSFDVSCMFAEAIRRLHNGESFTWLYNPEAFI